MTERSRRRPITLRTKLVALAVSLAFLVAAIIGAVSILTLQRSLEERLDAQLASAFDRAVTVLNARGVQSDASESIAQRRGHELLEDEAERQSEQTDDHDDDDDSDEYETPTPTPTPTPRGQNGLGSITDASKILNGPAQAPGTIALVLDGGNLTGGYLADNGAIKGITDKQLDALSHVVPDAKPHTVTLANGLGEYRVQGAIVDENAVIVGLPVRDVRATVMTLSATLVTVATLGLLALALIATVLIRRTMRPLEQVADAADSVAGLELARGEVTEFDRIAVAGLDDRTEVGRVVTAVNSMMENVESALIARESSEQKVRKFVADASHELRTPLASIRGYSELVRRMGGELPDDVQKAVGRIESESVRMTELVEDLLLLARLDEGQQLTFERVNLTDIAVDAVGDATVTGDDHRLSVEGVGDAVFVRADAHRIHQAVANLIANAQQHTPAGTDITVTVRAENGDAVVSVEDTGPGIPADIQLTIFSRFVRADSSRTRDASSKSTGLGLSIVKAIVDAHRGSVSVASEPGHTQFVIRLPLA